MNGNSIPCVTWIYREIPIIHVNVAYVYNVGDEEIYREHGMIAIYNHKIVHAEVPSLTYEDDGDS